MGLHCLIVMDAARQHLDADISRAERTASMLEHLADVVENGPRQAPGATYKEEATDALLHGAELARESRVNLMHCAQIYDEKILRPLPPVGEKQDGLPSLSEGELRGSD
jgi:hypothetical protein